MPRSTLAGARIGRPVRTTLRCIARTRNPNRPRRITVVSARPLASAQDDGWAPPSAVWVDSTGHSVDKTFLGTWRANQSLIGDPISQEVRDRVKLSGVKTKTRTIQYYNEPRPGRDIRRQAR